jgi:AcrR family transcriptional regulator
MSRKGKSTGVGPQAGEHSGLRSPVRWPDQPAGTKKGREAPSGERRTQAARSQATREALIAAARGLFAERGYAAVGTEEIVRRAGVTRGALYHHFEGKRDLLRAVYEQIESEFAGRLMEAVPSDAGSLETLGAGAQMFLDACLEPEVQQIVLLDAPAVLGWEEWREIAARYGLGLIEGILATAMETGEVRDQPLRPLAHALMGALDEVAMLVARSDDTAAARAEAGRTVTGLVDALRA